MFDKVFRFPFPDWRSLEHTEQETSEGVFITVKFPFLINVGKDHVEYATFIEDLTFKKELKEDLTKVNFEMKVLEATNGNLLV